MENYKYLNQIKSVPRITIIIIKPFLHPLPAGCNFNHGDIAGSVGD